MTKKSQKEHEELMHYTNECGLHGIVASKTLWASHTAFANDAEEVVGFFHRVLPVILRPEFKKYIKASKAFAARVKAADHLGIDLFEDLLAKIVNKFEEAQRRAQDFYVFSTCTTEDPWISQNGLLSQWRGYGAGGGYAVVFDYKRLKSLLSVERKMYHEEGWAWGDVQYTLTDLSRTKDVVMRDHIREIKRAVYKYWSTSSIKDVYPAFESITVLSTMTKHKGFEEEKEVRMVISEPSVEIGADPRKATGKQYRKTHAYLRNGVSVPCIHIFEDQKLNALPIQRVIVGPHPEKLLRKRAVEILLRSHGINAAVLVSDTPFRGK